MILRRWVLGGVVDEEDDEDGMAAAAEKEGSDEGAGDGGRGWRWRTLGLGFLREGEKTISAYNFFVSSLSLSLFETALGLL